MTQSTKYVRLDIWRVPTIRIAQANLFMATHRLPLRKTPALSFFKLMGTGSGQTFTMRDADLHHWAVLTVWNDQDSRDNFDNNKVFRQWQAISSEHAVIDMTPLSSRGTWNQQQPFGQPTPTQFAGLHAALTRATIKPRWWREFWRSVPPVSADLNSSPGLRFAIGIGEAPVGMQGTFSLWSDNNSITQFASQRQAHAQVIQKTHATGWYSEELFARFMVTRVDGSFEGAALGAQS